MYINQRKSLQQNPKTFLKTMNIIHVALFGGQVTFAIITFSLNKQQLLFSIKNTGDVFFFIAPGLAVFSFVVSIFLFKKLVSESLNKNTLSEKLTGYQSAVIVRSALLEGASLFGIVVFMLTSNLFYLFISTVIMLYFLTLRPTADKTASDLQLTYDEKAELEA
ncbi:hypothetical protein [Mucilaginibacter sp. SP1R1]|uniref:hypothetical protein n=1 Tax=Mucilaginibacter sp. SP1R1 TaxID=2723091 RepID=UPI00161E312A|nr:hypothetical protein [Mucilaginibacter sp. SP1R1]MBB6150667.1 hypothetical protein [Mucilaginibacter sp. SP1R1]